MRNCKLCGNILQVDPILHLNNMPKAAQHLPLEKDLSKEKGVNIKVLQCPYCGLVQLDAEPVDYYKDVIRASSVSKDIYNDYLKRFKLLADSFSLKGKNVLEVGCGDGTYLHILRDAGMEAFGVENSVQLVNECREKGLAVRRGFFDGTYECEKDKFYAFFMLNYLEHLPKPVETLKNIYNILEDDAIGIIEVPSLEMMLQKKLITEFTADHLSYFNIETLTTLLNLSGFEVISCEFIRDDYVLCAIVKKRRSWNLKEPILHLNSIIKEVEDYININTNVAIWGAGHQAFTLLCMINNYKKISCIIDSAKFKQGLFSPTTHIKILSPEIISDSSIKSILIIAGSYNLEIAKMAEKKYKGLKISILTESGVKTYGN